MRRAMSPRRMRSPVFLCTVIAVLVHVGKSSEERRIQLGQGPARSADVCHSEWSGVQGNYGGLHVHRKKNEKDYTTQAVFAVEQRLLADRAQAVVHTQDLGDPRALLRGIDAAPRCCAVLFLKEVKRNLTTVLLGNRRICAKTR
eukprot:IDg7353t1